MLDYLDLQESRYWNEEKRFSDNLSCLSVYNVSRKKIISLLRLVLFERFLIIVPGDAKLLSTFRDEPFKLKLKYAPRCAQK